MLLSGVNWRIAYICTVRSAHNGPLDLFCSISETSFMEYSKSDIKLFFSLVLLGTKQLKSMFRVALIRCSLQQLHHFA